jgi:sorting nexin-1/2
MSADDSGYEYDANIVIERPSSETEGSPSIMMNAATPSKPPMHPRLHVPGDDSAAYVTVSDPTQYTEGIKGKYIMYRVAYDPPPPSANNITTTSTSGCNRPPLFPYATSVNRRYSDFSWLFDHLHKERPGAIVPPLPEKQQVSRFTESFIEERRFHLEIFLRRVVCNPELKDADCLLVFLGGGDAEFKKAQKDGSSYGSAAHGGVGGTNGNVGTTETLTDDYNINELIDATSGGVNFNINEHKDHSLVDKVSTKKAGIKKWIKEKKTTMQGSVVRSPDDTIFEQVEHYLSALHVGLKRMEVQATAMVKRDHDVSACMLEFGLACDALAYIEDDVNGSGTVEDESDSTCIGQTYRLIGKTADEISSISSEYHDRKLTCFQEPLRDHLKMVHAAKVALSKRNNRRITYSTYINSVDTKKASLHKYRIMQDQKAFGVEASLSKAEAEVLVAKANYDEASARVLREIDRFRKESAVAMYATMTEFARAEKEHTDKMNMIWGVLLPHVEELNGTQFTGKSFFDAAAELRNGKSSHGAVGEDEATTSVSAQMEHMPMPTYPPPPEPSANANVLESSMFNGAVRYRDPLPEE